MGYREHNPTTYVVQWPDQVIKVGYTRRRRWRRFTLRGAVVLALFEFPSYVEAFELESLGLRWLREHGRLAFDSLVDSVDHVGADGGGYRECYAITCDVDASVMLDRMRAYAATHGCVDASGCHVTGRYETERKSRQDTDENSRFPDRSAPVDNRESRVGQVA